MAGDRLQQPAIRAQRLADGRDMNPYGAVRDDDCARPRAPYKRILGGDFTV